MSKTFRSVFLLLVFILAIILQPVQSVHAFSFAAEINKEFTPISIVAGETSRLSITIFNPNFFVLENASFTDNLIGRQPGIKISTPNNLTNSCGGVVIANAGSTAITLSGGEVPPQSGSTPGECTISVDVTSTTVGNLINTIPKYGEDPSYGGEGLYATARGGLDVITNTDPANATLQVSQVQSPAMSKNFNPNTVWVGQSSQLEINIFNNDLNNSLTEATFTDNLPATFTVAAPLTTSLSGCGSASLTAPVGATAITLSNATILPNSTCRVRIRVVSNTQNQYTNTIPTGPVAPGSLQTRQGVTNTSDVTANINVQAVGIAKTISPGTIQQGDTSLLTITLRNPTGADYSGVGLIDNLPAGVTISGTPAVNQCGGSITYTANSITLTSGTIPAGNITTPGSCTITARITSTTVGTHTNTILANTMTGPVTNAFPASATLIVQTRSIGVVKDLGPSFVQGGTTNLTITLQNAASTTLTGVYFTDTMPAGLTITGTPTTSASCGGSAVVTSSANSLTLTNAVIPSGTVSVPGTCSIYATVTSIVAGVKTNTIPIGDVHSDQGVTNTTAASDATTVYSIGTPATVGKAYQQTTINAGGSSRLRITITAPNDTPLSGIAISDTLPDDLVIFSSPAPVTTCTGGTLTAVPGTKLIRLTGGTIVSAGGNCTITVYVTSQTGGQHINTIPGGTLSTNEGRTDSNNRSATLTVTNLSMSKLFTPDTISPNGLSRLTISLTNTNLVPLESVSLTDNLTSMGGDASNGVFVAPTPNATSTCGGTFNPVGGSQTISLTNGVIPASDGIVPGLCTISLDVRGIGVPATRTNTILTTSVIGTVQGTSTTMRPASNATDALTITPLSITVNKGFDPIGVTGGNVSELSIELDNPNNASLSRIQFTDNMPAGMIIADPPNFNVGTCGGTLTGIAGNNSFTYEGGSLPASGNCTLTLNATMNVTGTRTNTIYAEAVTTFEGAKNPQDTSASLVNLPGASISKSFAPNPVSAGEVSYLTITITNMSGISITGMGLIDNLPDSPAPGLIISDSPAAVNNCSGDLTAIPGSRQIELTNGTLTTGNSCTLVIPVESEVPNDYLNTIPSNTLTSEEDISNPNPASDTLEVTGYSIGNRVWEDNGAGGGIANNGLRDGTEPGLNGVTVHLYQDIDNDDVADGASLASTTTDANGYYRFDNQVPGNYIVEVITPAGYIASTVNGDDPDNNIDNDNNGMVPAGNNIRSKAITIENNHIEPEGETDPALNPESGEAPDDYSNRTLDFGFFKPFSLGNRVWNDNGTGVGGVSNDGLHNGDEPGMSGITVRLYRDSNDDSTPDGTYIAYAITDADGYYRFDDLTADTYIIEILPPTGYISSLTIAGDPDTVEVDRDNNGAVIIGSFIRSNPVTLGPGENEPINDNDPTTNPLLGESPNGYSNRTVDFGLIQAFSLGNRVWDDNGAGGGTANNGSRDGSEPGINGVTVNLYLDGSIIATTLTDGNGYYRFDNLSADDYVVEVILPGGYASSATSTADPNDNVDNDNNGANPVGNAVRSGSITLGPNGIEPINDGDPAANPTTGEAPNDYSNRTVDFGLYHSPFSLGNRVWNDNGDGGGIANNGVRDGTEPGIGGVAVRLFLDSDDNGTPDSFPLATQLTDSNGYYRFDNLITNTYIVEVLIPTGFMSSAVNGGDPDVDTADNDDNGVILAGNYIRSNPVTLGPSGDEPTLVGSDPSDEPGTGEALEGYSNRTVDFGFSPLASLGDQVWYDTNRNGIQDSGETGITGVTVSLYNSGGFIRSTTTTGGGLYSFIALEPGDYYVMFTLLTDYLFSPQNQESDDSLDSDADPTTGATLSTTLVPGQNDTTWDAGIYLPPASIGNYVWNDLNRDGIQDAGETGISGVTVDLFRPGYGPDGIPDTADDDSPIASTTTDGSGAYGFNELIASSYYIVFNLPGGYAFSPLDQGGNNALDSDANRTTGQTNTTILSPGENDLDWDAGMYQLANLGDRVWNDFNMNGIQDAGETGINGVTVDLYDSADTLVASTSTTTIGGVDGLYRFNNLEPDPYYLIFSPPGGYAVTQQDQGGNDTTDSDIDAITGQTATTVLTSGENDLSWDAGLYQLASIGDFVWDDLNKDGIQDIGEPGINGVTVSLYTSDGSLIDMTTTSGSGSYAFTNLEPRDYYVIFTVPTAYAFSPQNAGSDDTLDSDANPSTGETATFTLIPGENDISWDAGVYRLLSSFGNRVWVDLNGNGVQNNGEPGLNNVTVDLYDSSNILVGSTTTTTVGSDDGLYGFTDLIPDYYYAVFTVPGGYAVTLLNQGADDNLDSDADRTTGRTPLTLLDPGEDDLSWDMGLFQTTALGNRVWNDTNANGIQDSGEVGVNGITVNLYLEGFGLVGTTLTGTVGLEDGIYQFNDLVPGNYYVDFTLPANYIFSPADRGGNDLVDSDADRITNRTIQTTLDSGEVDLTWDAGIYLQNGLLGVAKRVSGDPVEVSPGTWDVTYIFVVSNFGNVPLTDIQVVDDLSTTFATGATFDVQSISSTDLTVNPGYTGEAGQQNLLAGTDSLDEGESGSITLVIRVVPDNNGPFNNSAVGSGQPFLGEPVTDTSQDGSDPDPDNDGDPTDNNDPTPIDFGPNLFDPPFGIKTLDRTLQPLLEWTMVWINNTNIVAVNAAVSDPIPVNTVFEDTLVDSGYPLPPGVHPAGTVSSGVTCEDTSPVTTTQYCYYEGPSPEFPRGRIVWAGTLGPDLGATDAAMAENDIAISFNVRVDLGIRNVQNIATIDSDLNGDGVPTDNNELRVASAAATYRDRRGLPDTGFTPGKRTILPEQPKDMTYADMNGMWIEIPFLGIKTPIVGVPVKDNGEWDVTWLGNQAGWLNGTAFPTWNGNSVITAHVTDPNGKPGLFADLGKMSWGNKIVIHSWGQTYTYEVRSVNLWTSPNSTNSVLKHEELPWMTLLTCRGYNETTDSYAWRTVIRAVLVSVTDN